ncbi:Hypothetical protein CINCED_3A007956 [Cinara cedri]|uniref:Uncharacterized protein n=1 Tax=Cinara cedri TaxID=506608 RepID=A0A5E4NAS2_9HEMI|nr:Hypothetical protein CINCED_3A007956 [Cinara cedri]
MSFGAPYYKSADYQTQYPAYLRSVAPPPVIVDVRNELHPKPFRTRNGRKTIERSGKSSNTIADRSVVTDDHTTPKRKSVTRKKRSKRRSRVNTNAACDAETPCGDDVCALVPSIDNDDYDVEVSPVEIHAVDETSCDNDHAHVSCPPSPTPDISPPAVNVYSITSNIALPTTNIYSTSPNISLPAPNITPPTPIISPLTLNITSPATSIPSRLLTAENSPTYNDTPLSPSTVKREHKEFTITNTPSYPPPPPPPPPPQTPLINLPQSLQKSSYAPPVPLPPPSPPEDTHRISAGNDSDSQIGPLEMCKRTAKRFEMECRRRRRLSTINEKKTQAKSIAEQARDVAYIMAAKRSWSQDTNDRLKAQTAEDNLIARRGSEYAEMELLGLGKCGDGGCWMPNSSNRLKNKLLVHFK